MKTKAEYEAVLEEIKELAKWDSMILDDLVHAEFSRQASDINNQGVEAQVDYLLEYGGFRDIEAIKDFIK